MGGRCTVVACVLIPLVLLSAAIWGTWSPFNDQLTLLWANPPMGPEQIQPQTVTTYTGWVSVSFLPRPLPAFPPKRLFSSSSLVRCGSEQEIGSMALPHFRLGNHVVPAGFRKVPHRSIWCINFDTARPWKLSSNVKLSLPSATILTQPRLVPASSVLPPPFLHALRVKNRIASTCSCICPSPPLADCERQRLNPLEFLFLPLGVPGVKWTLNGVLWRMICAKETATYFVGAFPCLRPKGKGGSVYKREAQKVTGEQREVAGKCACVCPGRGEGVCQSPAHTRRH